MDKLSTLSDLCEQCDLKGLTSPYLPKTFTRWRNNAFRSVTYQTVKYTDEVLLPRFLEKVRTRYFESILSSEAYSRDLGLSPQDLQSNEEFTRLAAVMAQWSVEIELATDLIDRAQLYGYYSMPKPLEVTFAGLQEEWGTSAEPSLKQMYRFLLHSVAYMAERTAGIVRAHVVEVVAGNLANSRNVIVIGSLYAYLCGSVPWAVLAILGTQTTWVVSGWLLMKLGRGLGAVIDSKQLNIHLRELREQFVKLAGQLAELNERGKAGVMACIAATSEEERQIPLSELSRTLESFLEKKFDPEREQHSFTDSDPSLDYITVSEQGDWLIVDIEDPEVTQLTKSLFTIET